MSFVFQLFVYLQQLKTNPKEKSSKLSQLENEYGIQDKILNQFKCIIYNWNVDKVLKYYDSDQFCLDYCIDDNEKYGCKKPEKQCPFKHSQSINLHNLIWGEQPNYEFAKYYVYI